MKCIYHSADFDGVCSAAIVRHRYTGCELIPWDYGFPVPELGLTCDDETVFMVDISLPFQNMVNLSCNCCLIVIDHHETFIREVIERRPEFKAGTKFVFPRYTNGHNEAACELTWEYLFPDKHMPKAVRLLGRYDVRDLRSNGELSFQHGLRAERDVMNPENGIWGDILTAPDLVECIMEQGAPITRHLRREYTRLLRDFSFFAMDDDGNMFTAVNRGNPDSMFMSNGENAAILSFVWRPSLKKWRFYLYSDKPDFHCGEYAKRFGGGGHRGAAGFHIDELPEWLIMAMRGKEKP